MNKSFNFSHIDNLWEIWKINFFFKNQETPWKGETSLRAGIIHVHEHMCARAHTFLSIKG